MYTSKLKVEKKLFVFLIDKIHYEETLYGIERMMYISLEISRSQVGKIFLYMKQSGFEPNDKYCNILTMYSVAVQ